MYQRTNNCSTFWFEGISEGADPPPKYTFILLFNRDELLTRETLPLSAWPNYPHILGGFDLKAGGSWLSLNEETGNIAWLTNTDKAGYKEVDPKYSRGKLIKNFLCTPYHPDNLQIKEFVNNLSQEKEKFNGFNLVCGNLQRGGFSYFGTHYKGVQPLLLEGNTCQGMSNGVWENDLPRVLMGKTIFASVLSKYQETLELGELKNLLMYFMQLRRKPPLAPDEEEEESAIFVEKYPFLDGEFGTRTTSCIILRTSEEGKSSGSFYERNYSGDLSTAEDMGVDFSAFEELGFVREDFVNQTYSENTIQFSIGKE